MENKIILKYSVRYVADGEILVENFYRTLKQARIEFNNAERGDCLADDDDAELIVQIYDDENKEVIDWRDVYCNECRNIYLRREHGR